MKIIPGNGQLELSNDGTLEMFFIGVGSAFAKTLFQMNFLIIKGDDHIMVDFGTTGQRALRETAGLEATDINVLLPTHSHSDHVGGIECMALMNRYVGIRYLNHPKLKMVINEEYEKILWESSLSGGLRWNERDKDSNLLNFNDYFVAVRPVLKTGAPRETWEVDIGDIHIEMFRTKHIPEQAKTWETAFISYGLFIDNRVFCSVDTRFDRELIEYYAPKSEVIFHDVQFFPGSVHSPLENLQTLDPEIKKKMHLIHYSDDWANHDVSDFAGYTSQGYRYRFD